MIKTYVKTYHSGHLRSYVFFNIHIRKINLFIFLLLASLSSAQNEVFQINEYTTSNGLVDENIKQISIDKEDNVWMLTRLGLTKFDRYNFTVINNVDFSKRYRSIAIDDNNFVWLLRAENHFTKFKEYNVDIYNPITDELKNISEIFPEIDSLAHKQYFNYLFTNHSRNIRLGLKEKKEIIYDKGKWFEFALTDEDRINLPLHTLDPISISSCSQDKKSFYSYNIEHDTTVVSKGKPHHSALILDGKTRLILHLRKADPKARTFYPDYDIYDIFGNFLKTLNYEGAKFVSDGKNIILFNSSKLLYFDIDKNKLIDVSQKLGKTLENLVIYDVKFNLNEIWVGTNNGLYKLVKTKALFNHIDGNTEKSFRNIIQFGSSIIACTNGGLKKINLNDGTSELISDIHNLYSLLQYNAEELIMTSFGSTLISWTKNNDGKLDTYIPLDISKTKHSDVNINHLCKTDNEQILLSSSAGVYTYNHKNRSMKLIESTNKIYVEQIVDNPNISNQLFLCSKSGLLAFNIDNQTVIDFPELKGIQVSDIEQDIDNKEIFWIASKGNGLIKWDSSLKTTEFFKIPQGLLHNNVHSINQVEGKIWLSTDYGISVYYKEDSKIITLTKVHGIFENEFNRHSHLHLNDSLLILGGVDGVTYFNPLKAEVTQESTPTKIIGIEYINSSSGDIIFDPIIDKDDLELKINRKQLKLNLVLESQSVQLSNSLRFLIVGKFDQWKHSHNHKIDLSEFSYGTNQLLISRQTGINQWSPNKLVNIQVLKPLYLRPYFYISFFISMLIGIIYFLNKQRNKQLRLYDIIQSEVNQKTKSLQAKNKALTELSKLNRRIFSVIGHDLRSPLISFGKITQSYSRLTDKSPNQEVVKLGQSLESNSKKLLNVVDKMLQWSKTNHQENELEFEIELNGLVQEIIELYKVELFRKQISIYNNIPDITIIESDLYAVQIIIRNLIQNAIKYSTHESAIDINYKKHNLLHQIEVCDTGVGIADETIALIRNKEKLVSNKGTNGEEGLGIGLILSMELVEKIGARLVFDKNSPSGTKITLQIPFLQNSI